jgi:cell division protein FtsW (lipid II flippase)
MSARTRELFALIPVALLVTAGFAQVFLVAGDEIGELSLTYGGYFLAVCVAAHVLLRIRLPHADPYLFPLCALLAAFGLVVLYRINETLAVGQATVFLLGLGAFAATIIFLRDYEVLQRYRYLIAVGSLALLLAPRLPVIGSQVNGAYLAVDLGPISFQPAELAKIGVVVFLASYLNDKRELLSVAARRFLGLTIPPLRHFGPLLLVWGAAMLLLVFIRDLGSSLMFFGAFLALLYVATNRFSYVLVGLVLFAAGAWAVSGAVEHVRDRFEIWLDPFAPNAPAGAGQITAALFTEAEGGLFGQGLGQALLKLPGPFFPSTCEAGFPYCGSILPEPHTDFIYAVIVAELGLFGACGLIACYALIAARGFKAAMMAPDGFSKLLASGLTAVFALQVFVIIGGVVKLIPLTGVTLPFVSYGGSSIVANMILLALLMLVSERGRRAAEQGVGA